MSAYTVSKTALLGLVKSLSFELGRDNIRVNCIAPGLIETKFGEIVSEYKHQYCKTQLTGMMEL